MFFVMSLLRCFQFTDYRVGNDEEGSFLAVTETRERLDELDLPGETVCTCNSVNQTKTLSVGRSNELSSLSSNELLLSSY